MAHQAIDAGSSLLRSDSLSPRRFPQGPNIAPSSFEDGLPDDDCEPRRRLTLLHLKEYHQARKVSREQASDEVFHRDELVPELSNNNEIVHRHRLRLKVTSEILQSDLTMLKGTLNSMTCKARQKALRHNIMFLIITVVSVSGNGILFLRKSHIRDFMYVACAAAGLNGLYRTLYWWASSHCGQKVKAVQDGLEKGTIRESHNRYFEGAAWSFLRNANLQ